MNQNNVTGQQLEASHQASKWWQWCWWISITVLIMGFGLWLGGVFG